MSTESLPTSPYCRVRARVASIWADGPDDDTHPDWRPAVGEKITLVPSISSQLLVYDAAGPNPIIVTVERVECVVDEEGWLTKSDGRPVYIAPTDDPLLSATGWTWTATIKGKSIAFSAPAGGVVNLALYVATPAVDATEYVSVVQIVADYLTANPPDVEQAVADYLTVNPPAAAPDATTAAKGIVRLAGDLGGTADAPTVPGLAGKADADHGHAIGDVTGLQDALDGKQAAGSYASATHDHDGTYAPALGADDNYVTDAEKAALHSHANKTALDAVSGVNTGDQDLSDYATTASLSTVATSGSYDDLTDTPTIPDSPDDIGAAPATHDHTAADIDSGAAADGHVLTADGAGGAAWEAPPAGGGGGMTVPLHGGKLTGGWALTATRRTLAIAAGQMFAFPLSIENDRTITSVEISVGTASTAGNVRLGIYTMLAGAAGALLADFGTVTTATTGNKIITDLTVPAPSGLYWLVAHADEGFSFSSGVSGTFIYGDYQVRGASANPLAVRLAGTPAYGALPPTLPPLSYSMNDNVTNVVLPIFLGAS